MHFWRPAWSLRCRQSFSWSQSALGLWPGGTPTEGRQPYLGKLIPMCKNSKTYSISWNHFAPLKAQTSCSMQHQTGTTQKIWFSPSLPNSFAYWGKVKICKISNDRKLDLLAVSFAGRKSFYKMWCQLLDREVGRMIDGVNSNQTTTSFCFTIAFPLEMECSCPLQKYVWCVCSI